MEGTDVLGLDGRLMFNLAEDLHSSVKLPPTVIKVPLLLV